MYLFSLEEANFIEDVLDHGLVVTKKMVVNCCVFTMSTEDVVLDHLLHLAEEVVDVHSSSVDVGEMSAGVVALLIGHDVLGQEGGSNTVLETDLELIIEQVGGIAFR